MRPDREIPSPRLTVHLDAEVKLGFGRVRHAEDGRRPTRQSATNVIDREANRPGTNLYPQNSTSGLQGAL